MSQQDSTTRQSDQEANRSLWERFKAGGWYYVVVLASLGVLSPIPMWHAWSRLRTRGLLLMASSFTAAYVVLVYVLPSASERAAAGETGSDGTGLIAVALLVAACFLLIRPRREVFGLERSTASREDLAVQRAMDNRARREKARALASSDPHLARELRIGRPDLPRDYDDGGLVDVNSAPAAVIADVCGIDERWAVEIAAARERRAGSYVRSAQIPLDVPGLPGHVSDRIDDRGVFFV